MGGLDFCFEKFGVYVVFGDFVYGVGYYDGKVVVDFDVDLVVGYVDCDVFVYEVELVGDGGGGVGVVVGSECVIGVVFLDFDVDVFVVEDLEELDVGFVWEVGVDFEVWVVFMC